MPKNTKVVLSILLVLICSVAFAQTIKNATTNTKIKDPNYKPNQNTLINAPGGTIPLASLPTEGFEGTTFPPTGWDTLNYNTSTLWNRRAPIGGAHGGSYSAWLREPTSGSNNNWLITPNIGTVSAGDSVIFWLRQYYTGQDDTCYIRVCTTATHRDTTTYRALAVAAVSTLNWQRKAYSLSAYAGHTAYIAFVDKNGGSDTLLLDDVSVKGAVSPTISISDTTGYEGNAGTKSFGFNVTLSAAGSDTVKINYTTVDSTATTADVDYNAASGQLVFAPGVTAQRVGVTVNGDTKRETNEYFKFILTTHTNSVYGDSFAVGSILNDDSIPQISISDSTGYEGNAGTKSFGFYIRLTNPSYQAITVHCATADSSATVADGDYNNRADTTLTFAAGDTIRKRIGVIVNGDTKREPTEYFKVNLTTPTNATISDNLGLGTILNDDSMPQISISDSTGLEGNAGTKSFGFYVTLSNASSSTVTVNYSTADNTATTADGDYTGITTTLLTFSPGVTSQHVGVTVNGDTKRELDETFYVNLATPGNATILDAQGLGTILNDDSMPAISISDTTGYEGNAGTKSFGFYVTLSNASASTVTVNYSTADNTATTVDGDYVGIGTTTLTFTSGQTSKRVGVTVNGDTKRELDETFYVNLATPVNATILDAQGLGTILNDDSMPQISISDSTGYEGNAGTKSFGFYVTLSNASASTVTVDYSTADNTATTANSDYVGIGSTTLTFSPGVTSQRVGVTVNGDVANEPNETFNINLATPVNATISDAQGVGTILNDDSLPSISITDSTGYEGTSGTKSFGFYVTLSYASASTVTVNYSTADNTATTADGDYTGIGSTTLTFNPGVTSQMIVVTVNGDTKRELDETFYVNLATPVNATILDAQGVGTILNDDSMPAISISDTTGYEGNSGTKSFGFYVTLSNPSASTVTVNYSTADNTATTADGDYTGITTTLLTFSPGVTSQMIVVMVNSDTKRELDETFYVNLATPGNATILDAQGLGTILNDDSMPAISISDTTGYEGNAGTKSFGFYVTLTTASYQTITVAYSTADNTATIADNDYASASGTLTFNPGVTSQRIGVTVNGDTKRELDETFFVKLTSPVNASFDDSVGIGEILNDDSMPTISITDTTGYEGNAGTKSFGFYVTLNTASYQTITVAYSTADNTATIADNDYVGIGSTTLTFNPGETSKRVGVTVNGDLNSEPNETFFVNLTSPTNASFGDNQGLGTILNDEGYRDVGVDSIITPGDTVAVNTPFKPVIRVINNSSPSMTETCTLRVTIWRFRVKYDSVCHISLNPLDSVIEYDTSLVITVPSGEIGDYGLNIESMPTYNPTWADLTWLSSPTHHRICASISMPFDADSTNNKKSKKFIVRARRYDLQEVYAGLLRSKTLAPDTITTGIAYNTFSVVANPGGPTASFRSWFKVIRMKTGLTVYSQYLDRTLAAGAYSCIYYSTGWVANDTGSYKIVSYFETRPGVDSIATNNRIERYYYAVHSFGSGPMGNVTSLPQTFSLMQNSPNPFSGLTAIRWQIPSESRVTISIYDATGRNIKTLVNSNFVPGYYNTTWNRTNDNNQKVSAGIYFYEMRTNNYTARRKMVITN